MSLDRIKAICTIALLVSLTILVSVCIVYVYKIGERTQATLAEIRLTANHAKKAVDQQAAFLNSKESQLLIRNNLALGSAAIGTIRLLNTTTVPRINRAIERFDRAGDDLAAMVRNTDRSVNGKIAPDLQKSIQDVNEAVALLSKDLHATTGEATAVLGTANKTTQDIDTLVNDPNITKAIQEIALASEQIRQSSANVQESTREVTEGLKEFPGMAQDLHKFTTAQSKATKLIIAARILPSLAELLKAIIP